MLLALSLIALLVLGGALVAIRSWRARRKRVLWENVLKHICSAQEERRRLRPAEIAGRVGLSAHKMFEVIQDLESAGLVRSLADGLEPTPEGERRGLHVLRGHRLWERYLADEARLPLAQLHAAADRVEHRLSADDVELLANHLGHPSFDPHGDPIPTAGERRMTRMGRPLSDWPVEAVAVVVHVEDEPRQGLQAALRAGLRPGAVLRVISRDPGAVVCETASGRCSLAPAVAAQVDVRPAAGAEQVVVAPLTLATLALGAEAEVMGLSPRCTGLGRRRLLDLGFTAGVHVTALLSNVGGSAHAYRIRSTTIALRKEQAEQVLIRPAAVAVVPDEAERRVER